MSTPRTQRRSSTRTSTSGIRRATTTRGCNDEPPIPFRYGDYRPIRRRYLPPDYRADARAVPVEKSVYVEAEWDPRDPVGEMRYIADAAPRARPADGRGGAGLARPRRRAARARAAGGVRRSCAACATSRAPIASPSDAAPGGMTDAKWRAGFASSRATACASTCRRRGGTCARRRGSPTDFPGHADHPQSHRPARRSQRRGHRRLEARDDGARACPNVAVKISGLGQRGQAVDRRRPTATSCCTVIDLFGVERCMFASNFPVDSLCATLRDDLRRLSRDRARLLRAQSSGALFRDNAMRIYAMRSERRREPLATRLRRRRPDGPADGQAAGVARLRGRARTTSCRRGSRPRSPPGARRPRRPPTPRATPTSCCSTCRRPRRSRRRCSARDGVASALDAAAARRRFLDGQGRQGPRVRRATARRDRLRLGRCAGVRRAAGVGHRHADGDGRRRRRRHRARRAADGATSPRASRTWARSAAASSRK